MDSSSGTDNSSGKAVICNRRANILIMMYQVCELLHVRIVLKKLKMAVIYYFEMLLSDLTYSGLVGLESLCFVSR